MSAKYIYIANQLRDFLTKNTSQSVKLPTEKELCTKYSVSRQTIRKALSVLADEQLIISRQGSGSYSSKNESTKRTRNIALLISSDSDYIYPRLISEIKGPLQAAGYTLSVFITGNDINIERNILKSLSTNSVCGIIAETCQNIIPSCNDDVYNYLHGKGIPILFFDYGYVNIPHIPSVHYNDFSGAQILCQHLIDNGHKNIGTIFLSDMQSGINRYHGYMTALRNNNMEVSNENVFWVNTKMISNLEQKQDSDFLADIIRKKSKSCSAFICQNDEISYWLIKELTKADISVPEDISIVAFTNSYLNDLSDTPVTTVTAMSRDYGKIISHKLLSLMQGRSGVDSVISLELLEKKSVKRI